MIVNKIAEHFSGVFAYPLPLQTNFYFYGIGFLTLTGSKVFSTERNPAGLWNVPFI